MVAPKTLLNLCKDGVGLEREWSSLLLSMSLPHWSWRRYHGRPLLQRCLLHRLLAAACCYHCCYSRPWWGEPGSSFRKVDKINGCKTNSKRWQYKLWKIEDIDPLIVQAYVLSTKILQTTWFQRSVLERFQFRLFNISVKSSFGIWGQGVGSWVLLKPQKEKAKQGKYWRPRRCHQKQK